MHIRTIYDEQRFMNECWKLFLEHWTEHTVLTDVTSCFPNSPKDLPVLVFFSLTFTTAPRPSTDDSHFGHLIRSFSLLTYYFTLTAPDGGGIYRRQLYLSVLNHSWQQKCILSTLDGHYPLNTAQFGRINNSGSLRATSTRRCADWRRRTMTTPPPPTTAGDR